MTTVIQERLDKLATMTLDSGAHDSVDAGMCAMEAVAWLAGEPHSDHPQCVCDVIGAAMRKANDRMPPDVRNELLRPLLTKIIGTRGTLKIRKARAFIAADFAVRVFAPMALEAHGRTENAAKLRAAAPIVDKATAEAGRQLADAADAAYAADAADAAYAADAAAAAYAYAADAAAAAYAYAAYAAADAAAYAAYAARRPIWLEFVKMIEAMIAVS